MKHSTKLILALSLLAAAIVVGILIMHNTISKQMLSANTNSPQGKTDIIGVDVKSGESEDSEVEKFKNPFKGIFSPKSGEKEDNGTPIAEEDKNGENEPSDAREGQGNKTEEESPAAKERIFTESGREVVHFVYVKDGDTIVVTRGDGEEITVRYIGINTPESVAPEEYTEKTGKENNDFGKKASDHAKAMYRNTDILYLEYDTESIDPYGRTLAYIYISDTHNIEDMANAKLLIDGYASIMKIEPNTRYADNFSVLQEKAREEKAGLWADEEFYNNYQNY